jgi:alpha-mannosidase
VDFEVADATATDLPERPLPEAPSYDGRRVALRPRLFELVTLRLRRGQEQ